MQRRTFLLPFGSALLSAANPGGAGQPQGDLPPARPAGKPTLATVPIEVGGDWGASLPGAAQAVLSHMRDASISGVRVVSDRQPERIRVDNYAREPPHIWLHFDHKPFAWIIVDIGERDWSRLAYQFGHEFGHVMCNIWSPEGNSANPSAAAWLEEALAEAVSIRGLGALADRWATNPPFPNDQAFAGAIRQYRDHLVTKYRTSAAEAGATDLKAWFRGNREVLAANGDIGGPTSAAVSAVLAEMTTDPAGIEALGALNRWPPQSGLSLEDYLSLWTRSSAELGALQRLPMRLKKLLIG